MITRRARLALVLLSCCALWPLTAAAQNIQFTQGAVGSGLDNSIRVPIISYPGRGAAGLPVNLYYSSRVWRIGHLGTVNNGSWLQTIAEAVYAEHSTSGWKTSLDVPKVEWPQEADQYYYTGKPYCFACGSNLRRFRVRRVYIHMPDGSRHELRENDQPYEGAMDVTGAFYSVDGSRLRYDSTSRTTGTLYLPDGSRYVLAGATAQFIDRNGNALSYDGQARRWTDALGREVGMPFPVSPASADYSYAPPGVRADKPYVFRWRRLSEAGVLTPDLTSGQAPPRKPVANEYLPHPSQPPTNQSGGNYPQTLQSEIPYGQRPSLFISASPDDESNPTTVVGRGQNGGELFDPVVLTEILLPNGLSYRFTYNVYGEVDKVVYPTGGYEYYQLSEAQPVGDLVEPYSQASRAVTLRQQSPRGDGGDLATWRYAVSAHPNTLNLDTQIVSTTAPDDSYAEVRRHNFRAPLRSGTHSNPRFWPFGFEDARQGMTYEERAYDKHPSQGGVMLRRTLTEWAMTSAPVPPRTGIVGEKTEEAYRNPRPVKTVSLVLDTGGDALAKLTTSQYDTTHQFTTGLDLLGMTESYFAEIDQTDAQTGAMDVVSSHHFPPASSSVTTYVQDSAYRDRNMLGLVSSVVLKDASGQPVSKTETFYDEAAYQLVNYSDLANDAGYVDPGGTAVRGNPTTVRRYLDPSAAVPSGQECASGVCLDTHAQFDQCGNPVNFWNERGIQSEKEYSSLYKHAYLTRTTSAAPDPSGRHGSASAFTSESTYDAVTGQVLTATDANGQTTSFGYEVSPGTRDPLNRLRRVDRPDGGWTKTDYNDVVGNLYAHAETRLDATRSTHAYQFFDRLGRASRSFALEAGTTYVVSETRYDQVGRASQASNPFRTTIAGGADPGAAAYWATAEQPSHWTTTAYDALGRVVRVTLPDGTTVETAYAGVFTTVTDQAGRQRRQKADALGRVVRVDEPGASGSLGAAGAPAQPSFYEYDTLGNVVRISQGLAQPGLDPEAAASYVQHRYFRYDALSRLTHERQAEQAGMIPFNDPVTGNASWSRRLVYDEQAGDGSGESYRGLPTSAYDARGVRTQLYYDRLSRTRRVTYSDGTPAVTNRYDEARAGYFNKGRLIEVATEATAVVPQTSQAYDYDLMGRVASHRQTVGETPYAMGYGYNFGGGLTSQTYPSGRVVAYGYDGAGRLQNVGSGATAYASAMMYTPFGGLESMALGNGATYSLGYTGARMQLSSVTLAQGATTVQRYEYKYGRVDMATGAVDEAKNSGQVARVEGFIGGQRQWQQRFAYDELGRLSSAGEYRGDNNQQSYLLNYDYDRFGNRYQKQAKNHNNPVAQHWVEDGAFDQASNRFTSGITYDDAGNVTIDSRFRLRLHEYDANNRQRQSSYLDGTNPVISVYDGAGQRVATVAGGHVTQVMIYDAFGKLVAEYGGSVTNGGTKYVAADHQGSTRVVMAGQTVVARHDYLPFGEDSLVAGVGMRAADQQYGQPGGVRHKYAGMEGDYSTGMSHTLWREYDSLSARWTATDPYAGSMELASPQSFNRYNYVNNDPVNLTDPLGLMPASQGWGGASASFWGGDPGFFDPHFGGPGVIADAQAGFDGRVGDALQANYVNALIKKGLSLEDARRVIAGNGNLEIVATSVTMVEEAAEAQQTGEAQQTVPFVVSNVDELERQAEVGSHEGYRDGRGIFQCARLPLEWQIEQETFVESRINRGHRLTPNWVMGEEVTYGMPLQKGTVLATFDREAGIYRNLNSGNHTVIFLGWDSRSRGMKVVEQFAGPPRTRVMAFDSTRQYHSDAGRFNVVNLRVRNAKPVDVPCKKCK
ncbi:MAG TPA: BPSL0067 family protein [Pyrinomonadaceae bacterium]|nr:BPSL0067 family protein [Pyrinomonadaceae bacterium]